ncbi:MAG TPA: hypothetical protein VFZ44_15675 [Pyrinomonadaceae bacterium]
MKTTLLALCLLAALAASAAAQGKALEVRDGDSFKGPVKSVSIEQADYSRAKGMLVEGPRRRTSFVSYAPDGKSREWVDYAPDGSVKERFTHVYDDSGNDVEVSQFDAKDNLKTRRVYVPQAGEELTYDGDGGLRYRRVFVRGYDGRLIETRLYDATGALKERRANERAGGLPVWNTYRADGTLRQRDTYTRERDGRHRTVMQTYGADGSVVRRRVLEIDAADKELRDTVEKGNAADEPPKRRVARAFDSRGNLSKSVTSVWNEATNEYEPSSVSYYTITYYR